MNREEKIIRTFVELADTLIGDFDVIDLLQQLTAHCCDILDVTDVAVLLAYPGSDLYSPVPCDPSPALVSVLDRALTCGPAKDAHTTAAAVHPGRLATAPASWQPFATAARDAGYCYASAVPLRLRDESLGSLLLLRTTTDPLPSADLDLAQAFADATTISLLHARTVEHAVAVNEQLHTALHSRITIEQAKGAFAVHQETSGGDAFATMRAHARRYRLKITEVARHVLTHGDLPAPPPAPRQPRPASTEG
ncbi:GAF and ANTAR domain-containing protein [Streptomyces sp. NPDC046939]|uniref:GAF and ANTAR domain-containing protein n=1 Tax=Streptomyces sp. NPDC046939 TaxID=3155376 RepID=UPI0033C4176B